MAEGVAPQTVNQVVAFNLRKARELRGWTQEGAAAHLEPYLGKRWSRAVFSAAERSVDGKRARPFDADELVAFARGFGYPVEWFLLPPEGVETLQGVEGGSPLSTPELVDLVFPATEGAQKALSQRLEALFRSLPLALRTSPQRVIAVLTGAYVGAQVKTTINLSKWSGDLRSLADSLELIEQGTLQEAATKMLRRNKGGDDG